MSLIERDGTDGENLPETHNVLKLVRAAVERRNPDCLLLAEANQSAKDTLAYFGRGDECHMAFHFPLMPRLFMALAQEDRQPIVDILTRTLDLPPGCQWALFLRNHDELTLEMVSERERDYLWNLTQPTVAGGSTSASDGVSRRCSTAIAGALS